MRSGPRNGLAEGVNANSGLIAGTPLGETSAEAVGGGYDARGRVNGGCEEFCEAWWGGIESESELRGEGESSWVARWRYTGG